MKGVVAREGSGGVRRRFLLGGRGLFVLEPLLVGGSDLGLPGQQVVAEGFDLLIVLSLYDVVLFAGILREVEELLTLVAVVIDVLLVALYARQARTLVIAARHERAFFERREHRRAGVCAATDLEP